MRRALVVSCLLVAIVATSAANLPPVSAGPLDTRLSVDFQNVPLATALAVVASELGVTLEGDSGALPPPRVTLQVEGVSAEVLLELLAWQSGQDWLLVDGTLQWGPVERPPSPRRAQAWKERTARLDRRGRVVHQSLRRPVSFRLSVQKVALRPLLRFLEQELDVPVLLDARCGSRLDALATGEFQGVSAAELLTQVLSSAGGAEESGAPLRWTVLGEAIVVSTSAGLRSLWTAGR